MIGPKRRKGLDEEAACRDDSEDDDSDCSADSDDSMNEFIEDDLPQDPNNRQNDDDSSKCSMEDSAEAVSHSVVPVKKRGRPPGSSSLKVNAAIVEKPPGHSCYPLNNFSLTITKSKDDVSLDALDRIAAFIEDHCIKGGVSTEVGRRIFQLQLRGVLKMHWPKSKEHLQKLQKILKGLLPENGKLYRVLVKPFANTQNFSAMIGYITKDQGKISILDIEYLYYINFL